VYVPNSIDIKNIVLREMHNVSSVGHPGYQKSITVVRSQYFCPGLKKEVTNYISRCIECDKVKTGHKHPMGPLQPFPIPKWKWEVVMVYFIINLPKTVKQHDSIMVVVEKLTKATYFIHVKKTHKEENITEIYMKEFSRLHGVPKAIVSSKDFKFTSKFWQGLFKGFGTNLNLSMTYHLDSNGQTKRINRIIEDILNMYVMDQP